MEKGGVFQKPLAVCVSLRGGVRFSGKNVAPGGLSASWDVSSAGISELRTSLQKAKSARGWDSSDWALGSEGS